MKPSISDLIARLIWIGALMLPVYSAIGSEPSIDLFNGHDLSHWQFPEGAWSIDDQGALTCHMQEATRKDGSKRRRGMGYIWTKETYADFKLELSYKLSPGANSGVFFRADPNDPVQRGLEIQLYDDASLPANELVARGKKRNGALYDAQAPRHADSGQGDPAHPAGTWNKLKLMCRGPNIRVEINGVEVMRARLDQWDTPGKNPDGTKNKFRTALGKLPQRGHIGFQNHGDQVWFKEIRITD